MRKWIQLYGILIWMILAVLTGCERPERLSDEAGASYQVYYANTSMTRLIPQAYVSDTTDPDILAEELIYALSHVPKELDRLPVLSDKVHYHGHRREDVVLYLNFDSNYTSMDAAQEILCRMALAKTLTQIDGIEYINIYAGEQPIADTNGNPVGMISANDFVESISDVNSFEKTELVLYFTDSTGERLIPELREVVYDNNTSLEKLVVEQLLMGPEHPGLSATLPEDAKLISVSVNENVCYLNFDASFSDNALEIKDVIPIYSIVNSLVELPTVTRVQFMINGAQNVMFRDSISLNTPFERNLDLQEEHIY